MDQKSTKEMMIEQFQWLKRSGDTIEVGEFIVSYNKSKEHNAIAATYGPWSIEGPTDNMSHDTINDLGMIVDCIRSIE